MESKKFKRGLFLGLLCSSSLATLAQVPVDYSSYPDYDPVGKPDWSLMKTKDSKSVRGVTQVRPDHVNNAETKYFPPVFNQDGGSCGSASRISYMFNYEINALRDVDGSLEENQYPSHFTWLLTNCGPSKETMAIHNGIPNVPTYGGRTYSKLFGNQDCANPDFGWMQGYDRWYEAMQNRLERNANFPLSVQTEEGREAVKNWLWNHSGDSDFGAGGIAGIGVASGGYWKSIGDDADGVNSSLGLVGKKYVSRWGRTVDHALTIVGYDDRVVFDLDGNGVYGEKDKDEVGAWIIVNSWGSWWCNNGFVYCPYRNAVSVSTPDNAAEADADPGSDWAWTPNPGNYYKPEIYYMRKNYRPLRTIKIKMNYSRRSEVQVNVGISSNPLATAPERTMTLYHFNYTGDGTNASVAPEVPMLGKWGSELNYETMEFGYDLTDFSADFDTRKPLKYFLQINTKSGALGEGKIEAASIIDYEFDTNGVETPFDVTEEGTIIKNKGGKTLVGVVVQGEPLYAPTDLVLTGKTLTWKAPTASLYSVTGFEVYRDGTLLTKVAADVLTYTDGEETTGSHSYYVKAVYNREGDAVTSNASNEVRLVAMPSEAVARNFVNSGFTIPGVFDKSYDQCTIEFYLKPSSVSNYNQQIGPGWGKFLFHANSNGTLSAGWNTSGSGNRIDVADALKVNVWSHVAIVVNGNKMTVYVNGQSKGSITSSSYSGIGGFGDLVVGASGNAMNGRMAEFRIWDCAWSTTEAMRNYRASVVNIGLQSHLLAYYRMDGITADGKDCLNDCVGGNHAPLTDANAQTTEEFTLLSATPGVSANFTYADGPYYVGQPIEFINASAIGVARLEWEAEGATIADPASPKTTITFNAEGRQQVVLNTYNSDGSKTTTSKKILTLVAMPEPTADFNLSTTKPAIGETIHLAATNPIEGCTYEWTMPKANVEHSTKPNVSIRYAEAGTFTVTLKVTSADGKTYTETKTIEAAFGPPVADFSVSPSVVLLGEKVYLTDKSQLSPNEWTWIFNGTTNGMIVDGANSSFEPAKPGAYDVTLFVRNEYGNNRAVRKRGLVVCNADGQTGLNFTGSAPVVTTTSPWQTATSAFTLDWWMYAKDLSATANEIGDEAKTLLLRTSTSGAFTLSLGGEAVTSADNVVVPSEWHHYAVTFGEGSVRFYRDGILVDEKAVAATSVPVLGNLHLGATAAPMNAILDEFRVWTAALTENQIQSYANQPIEDIATATDAGLCLYYSFNQSGGDVQDQTGKNHTGVRSGFGPDGDAWGSSLGIFCLNFERTTDQSRLLKNYKAPFLTNKIEVADGEALQTGTSLSPWVIENAVDGTPVTGFYVNTSNGKVLDCVTSTNGFASSLSNHKLYQTVNLATGIYELTVNPTEGTSFPDGESYVLATDATDCPDYDASKSWNVLAAEKLTTGKVAFAVVGTKDIVLGLNVNLTADQLISIGSFNLTRKPHRYYKANGESVGIEHVVSTADGESINVCPEAGGIRVWADRATRLRLYDLRGVKLKDVLLEQPQFIALDKGIYIVNNRKVVVD